MDAGKLVATGVEPEVRASRLVKRRSAMRVEYSPGVAEIMGKILTVGAVADDMIALIGADIDQHARNGPAVAGEREVGCHDPALAPRPRLGKAFAGWTPDKSGVTACWGRQFFDLSTSWFLAIHGIIARSSAPVFSS